MKYIKIPSLLILVFFFGSCLKDENVKKFTYYVPEFATAQEVQDNVKLRAPQPIENMGNIILYQNFLLAVEHTKGIHVVDITNPSSPVKLGFIPIPGNNNMAIRNNYLYADCYMDLFIIDISNLQNLQMSNVKKDVFKYQRYVMGYEMDDNHIIVDWEKRDSMVSEEYLTSVNGNSGRGENIMFASFSGQTSGSSSGGGNSTGGSMARFTLVNDYMYAVDNSRLYCFSLSNPIEPSLEGELSIGGGIETIYPFKDNLFIGSTTGMMIYNISSQSSPTFVSRFSHATSCDPVIANDKFAYVTLRSGNFCAGNIDQMDVLNIENILTPKLIKTYPFTNPYGLGLSGNTMFLCDGRDGLRILDATDATNIKEKKRFKNIGVATDVIIKDNHAFVVTQEDIRVFEFSNSTDVEEKGKINK